jgi:hypothetical protein
MGELHLHTTPGQASSVSRVVPSSKSCFCLGHPPPQLSYESANIHSMQLAPAHQHYPLQTYWPTACPQRVTFYLY